MKQLFQLIKIQYLEFFREPGVIFWALLFPVVMAWGLGLAFKGKATKECTIAWVKSTAPVKAESQRAQVQQFVKDTKARTVNYHFVPVSWDEAGLMVKRGKTSLILLEKGDSIKYCFDARNSEAQLTYLQLSEAISHPDAKEESTQIQPLDQKGMRYIDFLIPGLLAMNIMFGCMWGVSYGLVEKRSKKLMRRMVATPLNKTAFLFSYFVTRITLSFVELGVLLFFAWWYFDITVQGSMPALITLLIVANAVFFGLSVLLSSRTSKTQIANGIINAVTMPMMICSGIFFSYHNFPSWLESLIMQLPLTRIADGMRSIFIEGAGFSEIKQTLVVLSSLAILFFISGKRIYKWY